MASQPVRVRRAGVGEPAPAPGAGARRSRLPVATRLALTLRNPGDPKAAISEFRFTVREVRSLESWITADYDIDVDRILASADDLSPEAKRLKTETTTLRHGGRKTSLLRPRPRWQAPGKPPLVLAPRTAEPP